MAATASSNNTSTNNPVSNASRLTGPGATPSSANDLMDLLSSMDQLLAEGCPEDPGFEATCGSPAQPVDLSTLDCISLDFPLNSSCDIYDESEGERNSLSGSLSDNTPSFSALISVSSGLDHNHESELEQEDLLHASSGNKAHADHLGSKRMKGDFSVREQVFIKEGSLSWDVPESHMSSSQMTSAYKQHNHHHKKPGFSPYHNPHLHHQHQPPSTPCHGEGEGGKEKRGYEGRDNQFNISSLPSGTSSLVGQHHRKWPTSHHHHQHHHHHAHHQQHVPAASTQSSTALVKEQIQFESQRHLFQKTSSSSSSSTHARTGISSREDPVPSALAVMGTKKIGDGTSTTARENGAVQNAGKKGDEDGGKRGINQQHVPSSPTGGSPTTTTTTTYRMSMRICEKRRIGEDWNGLKDLPPSVGASCMVVPPPSDPATLASYPVHSGSNCEDPSFSFPVNNNIYKMIQGLNPVFPAEPRDLQAGHWFRCQLCHTIQETQRLYSHAKEVHNLADMASATTQCISPFRPSFSGPSPHGSSGCQKMTSPGPISLGGGWTSVASSNFSHPRESSSDDNPPNEIISNQELPDFEQDLDAVVDDKFIDSLIRTIPPSSSTGRNGGANLPPSNQHQHSMALINQVRQHSAVASTSSSTPLAGGGPIMASVPGPTLMKLEVVSSSGSSSSCSTTTPSTVLQASPCSSSVSNPTSSSSVNTNIEKKLNREAKKSSPQFRWRRRKRRSKAQYPEMSRYLLPIDEGEEVQHLGRTLECQLCGLRGKRCHLTLHFKAKHSEVIELTGSQLQKLKNKQNAAQKSSLAPGANGLVKGQPNQPSGDGTTPALGSKEGLGKY